MSHLPGQHDIHLHGTTGAESSNHSSDTPPNHLRTNIEPGQFDEKNGGVQHTSADAIKHEEEEEEDEDMDALIDELESQDGHAEDEEAEEENGPAQERPVPEDLLQTDTRIGLTDSEVQARRKKWGLNQMKEEKENLFLKFLGYFIGPIQFVMEVRLCRVLTMVLKSSAPRYFALFRSAWILHRSSRVEGRGRRFDASEWNLSAILPNS